ncbi:MAG: hypothetical protein IJ496_02125 [Ruminococcus sp.]|nr:hypothetical protein [Ruminococcus sp.]
MEKKRHPGRRIIRTILAYLILNAGILGWIQVSAESGNRLHQAETAMAQVRMESRSKLEIAVLGNSAEFDLSPMQSKEMQSLLYAMADPVLLGTAVLLETYIPA